uniref:Rieske domain-containing protein n=1 Tax=Poecilia mexicana TaxID=48701 RepID=A0A3B3XAN5_9TELE
FETYHIVLKHKGRHSCIPVYHCRSARKPVHNSICRQLGEFVQVITGGPLCEGDIEEADGVLQVFCPWHDYGYDLRTGKSGTLLEQQVYEVKLVDGDVYVKHASHLSLRPFPANPKN